MSKETYKISNASNQKNSLTRQTANKMQIDYNIYLEEGSLERKLGDVVYDSYLLSSIMPPGAKHRYKIVKIIVTMEYEQ